MSQEKEITIYDIAKSLNISAATVSRGLKDHPAISKETKKRITEAAKKMGYRSNTFASNLRTQKSNTLGVIVSRLNSNFMADVLSGMEKAANEIGYNLIIGQSLESLKREIDNVNTMFAKRVDGLLISLAYDTKDINHLEQFFNKNIPVVFFDRVFEHKGSPKIIIDNYRAAYEAVSHLAEQGCKRIVHITGDQSKNVYSERFRGYKDALTSNGLTYDDELLLINDLSNQSGTDSAKTILAMAERPDAVFITNDFCAAACLLELKKHGIRIPEDIAVVGFNNDPVSKIVEPNLSSVNYPGQEMGEVAVQTLSNYLTTKQGIVPTHTVVLRHELIIRESSLKQKSQ